MQTEFEAKLLEIDIPEVEKKLKALGAKFIGRFEQKRYTYDVPKKEGERKWIRLRTDGNKTTLCLKMIENNNINGTKEIEFSVPNFEQTHEFLENIGRPYNNYQENIRIQYYLGDVELDIDCWPLIPPYLEVEGKNEEAVRETINLLGFSNHKTTSQNTIDIYNMYGIDINEIRSLKF